MKICILGDSLSLVSGHSKPAFELSCELIKQGFDVFIVTNKLEPEIEKKHLLLAKQYPDLDKVTIIELANFSFQLLNGPELSPLLGDCEYFHFFSPSLSIISKFNSRYPGRVIWQVTGDYLSLRDFWPSGFSTYAGYFWRSPNKLWNLLYKYAYKRVADRCKAVVCSTSYMYDRLRKLGIPSSNLVCLPFGVYPSLRQASPRQHDDEILFMYFGWLSPIRGFTDLLSAFDQVSARNSHARLLIGNPGGHPEEADMLSLVDGCTSRHAISILPWQDDVDCMLVNSDVVVLPFRGNYGYSQPPLVVVEAMNASKPVISTAVGCIDEFVCDQKNGLLVEPNSVDSLAKSMLLMADREKCLTMGQNAYNTIQEKSWGRVIGEYLALYRH